MDCSCHTLSRQPGTIIRANHVHDNRGMPGGIYLDDGSGAIEVTGNLIYQVPSPVFHNANAKDTPCTVHDNHVGRAPGAAGALAEVAAQAGPETPYRRK
jgi:hypothetical protein